MKLAAQPFGFYKLAKLRYIAAALAPALCLESHLPAFMVIFMLKSTTGAE